MHFVFWQYMFLHVYTVYTFDGITWDFNISKIFYSTLTHGVCFHLWQWHSNLKAMQLTFRNGKLSHCLAHTCSIYSSSLPHMPCSLSSIHPFSTLCILNRVASSCWTLSQLTLGKSLSTCWAGHQPTPMTMTFTPTKYLESALNKIGTREEAKVSKENQQKQREHAKSR